MSDLQTLIDRNRLFAAQYENDIARLHRSTLVPKEMVVSGHIYHVEHGTVEEIVAPAPVQAR